MTADVFNDVLDFFNGVSPEDNYKNHHLPPNNQKPCNEKKYLFVS